MTGRQEAPRLRQTDAGDRARWLVLRRAARLGHLEPEGVRLLDEIHDRHPDWREEFA